MREPHVGRIGDQLLGQLVVAHEPAIGTSTPGAEVDLVDRHRRPPPVLAAALLEIGGVAPAEGRRIRHHGGRLGPHFRLPRKRVGLERHQFPVRPDDLELVERIGTEHGNEHFPDAGIHPHPHGIPPPVPIVERSDDADPAGIGSPDREMRAMDTLEFHLVRAELVEQPEMRSLADVVVVHRPEHRSEAVGVPDLPLPARIVRHIADGLALADRDGPFEEAGRVP